jgi:hypothetical protein
MQAENEENRRQLQFELGLMRSEYSVLLYGGKMQLFPEVSGLSIAVYCMNPGKLAAWRRCMCVIL